MFTPKQIETINDRHHRWNIDYGATRSGKTHGSYFKVPYRIAELPEGNMIMIGKTLSTLSYNVLEPMRGIFGYEHVSEVKKGSDGINYCNIFGRKMRVVGADNKRAVTKIQGAGLIYAYLDELTTHHKDVFMMLQSRLDSKEACCDATCNPDAPNHWLKKWQEESKQKGVDLAWRQFTIYDNTYLDAEFIKALELEYQGTVYFDRFILGRWVAAEGSCYPHFIRKKSEFIIPKLPEGEQGFIQIGVDFGGNKSGQAFNATFISSDLKRIYALKDYRKTEQMDPDKLNLEFIKFVKQISAFYPQYQIMGVWADSAEQVLKNGLQSSLIKNGFGIKVNNSMKREINERIRFENMMFGKRRFYILDCCDITIDAFSGAVWEDNTKMVDVRLDDGTSNIDTLDAFEYSFESVMSQIELSVNYGK